MDDLLRLLKRSIYLIVAAFIFFLFVSPLLVSVIVKNDGNFYLFGVGKTFEFVFSLAAKLSLLFSLPIVLLWFYRWSSDAFLPEEKRWIKRIGTFSVLLFFAGAVVGLFLAPRLIGIAEFLSKLYKAKLLISIGELVDLYLTIMLLTGLAFQFPVFVYLSIRSGILKKTFFTEHRRTIYLLFFVISMLITPGDMLVTDLLLTTILIILFELSLHFSPG